MISEPPGRQPHLAVEGLVDLLVHVVALEDRQRIVGVAGPLDPVGQLGADAGHVVADLLVQRRVVDHHAPVVAVELLPDDPDGHVGSR